MERYETATLELVTFDEDVITASESSNSTNSTGRMVDSCGSHGSGWAVYYTDGTSEIITDSSKLPPECS